MHSGSVSSRPVTARVVLGPQVQRLVGVMMLMLAMVEGVFLGAVETAVPPSLTRCVTRCLLALCLLRVLMRHSSTALMGRHLV